MLFLASTITLSEQQIKYTALVKKFIESAQAALSITLWIMDSLPTVK
jgi:hypothetical protein